MGLAVALSSVVVGAAWAAQPAVRQHWQALVDQGLHGALGQGGAGLELVDDDAFDLQLAVVVGLDFLHVFQQRVERTA